MSISAFPGRDPSALFSFPFSLWPVVTPSALEFCICSLVSAPFVPLLHSRHLPVFVPWNPAESVAHVSPLLPALPSQPRLTGVFIPLHTTHQGQGWWDPWSRVSALSVAISQAPLTLPGTQTSTSGALFDHHLQALHLFHGRTVALRG